MKTGTVLSLLAALAVGAAPARLLAQGDPGDAPIGPPRVFAGGALFLAQPAGEFRDYVNNGFGAGGHVLFRLGAESPLALRLDGGFITYGRETKRVPLSSTIGGRIQVDVETTNNIALFGIGPQLMVPDGLLRPYIHALVGASYFFTQSAVEGTRDNQSFAQTTNFDELTFSYGGGAGLYIPVFRGATTVSLDLGARYIVNGETRYLREGSIIDGPGADITINPIQSETNFFNIQLGVAVALQTPTRRR